MTGDLALALALADRADDLTMAAFAGDRAATAKADGTPVTETDREVERVLRTMLVEARPDDGFVGEETGSSAPAPSGRSWIVDPIDGTAAFVDGGIGWATQIALRDADGRFVVGVTSAPAAGARWWGGDGGAFLRVTGREPRRLRVTDTADLASASWVSHPVPDDRLAAACGRTVPVTSHGALMVAAGDVDVCLAIGGGLWDHAAFAAIVAAAGGRTTLLGSGALHTNGRLHEAALAVVSR